MLSSQQAFPSLAIITLNLMKCIAYDNFNSSLLAVPITIYSPTTPLHEISVNLSPKTFSENDTQRTLSHQNVEDFSNNKYRRCFQANDSLIGTLIPCTYKEKICLYHHMLYVGKRNLCQHIGEGVFNGWSLVRADKEEFELRSGRIVGIDASSHEEGTCPGYRMAYDGICYSLDFVHNVICECPTKPTPHIFGGFECRCSLSSPIYVEQPKEDGVCRIPDLRFSYFQSETHEDIVLKCSSENANCFYNQMVWMSKENSCFELLQKGPCPHGYVVALSQTAAENGIAEGRCIHERGGCPIGQKRFKFDNQCHSENVMKSLFLYFQNPFGLYEMQITEYGFYLTSDKRDMCRLRPRVPPLLPQEPSLLSVDAKPICTENDKSKCVPNSFSELPKPLLT